MLREKSNIEKEELETKAVTYADLYNELNHKYEFDLPLSMIQIAVNDEYIDKSREIIDGARIVFIPPVAGG